jgi:hypothetical protein
LPSKVNLPYLYITVLRFPDAASLWPLLGVVILELPCLVPVPAFFYQGNLSDRSLRLENLSHAYIPEQLSNFIQALLILTIVVGSFTGKTFNLELSPILLKEKNAAAATKLQKPSLMLCRQRLLLRS